MRCVSLTFLAVTFALSGCAGTEERSDSYASRGTIYRIDDGIDHEKVAKIEQIARIRGVKVIWANPPQKKREVASGH